MGFSQEIPIEAPDLLAFPGINTGISYFSLKPSQNLEVKPSSGGWTIQDTIRGVLLNLDFELVRYHWWHHLNTSSDFDAYSSLNYSWSNQLGTIPLPTSYPSTFHLNGSSVTGFYVNMLMKGISLSHTFIYKYSSRGSFHAQLGTGITHLSFYNNPSSVRIFESNAFAFDLGVGWKTTLFGRVGKRVKFGIDLGYSFRNFDFNDQDEGFKRDDGSPGSVSPIQTVSLNTPDVSVNFEFGEALFGAYTPYRDPYRLGLLNISAGTGLIGLVQGATINYDTLGTELSLPVMSTVSENYDLQIFKYNWPFHIARQANVDLFSGLGVRLWRSFQPATLPEGWARDLNNGSTGYSGMSFAPRILDIYLDHEIVHPFGSKFYTRVSAGTGLGLMTLYENVLEERIIDSKAFTWQVGTGIGYTIKGDGSSRVSFGAGLDYYHQAFSIDMDNSDWAPNNPGERIPITFIDLSQAVFSVNIGLMFGGYPNAAQKAHETFRKKKFTTALEIQQELLQFNKNHHNKKAVLIQKQMVEDSLVTEYYRDVRTILSQGKIWDAYSLIEQGDRPPGEAIDLAVAEMKIEISDRALAGVAAALKILDYELAEDLVLLALKSDPSCFPIAKVLLARSYIIRATVLYNSGVYGRSLYWLKQADGLTDQYRHLTNGLRLKIGDGRLEDANQGILKEDRKMVYEAMKEAKDLNPVLSGIVDDHLKDLEGAIKEADELHIAPMKRMALDNLMNDIKGLDPENFSPKIGMKGSMIVRYVGPPERKFQEGDYELYVYPKSESVEIWLYLRNGTIERIEYSAKQTRFK